jgi:hypothetical protein
MSWRGVEQLEEHFSGKNYKNDEYAQHVGVNG